MTTTELCSWTPIRNLLRYIDKNKSPVQFNILKPPEAPITNIVTRVMRLPFGLKFDCMPFGEF